MKNQKYTKEEVIELLLKERERGIKIAYALQNKYEESYKSRKKAGDSLAFVDNRIADTCRIIGNSISGRNALSIATGETKKDVLINDYKKELGL